MGEPTTSTDNTQRRGLDSVSAGITAVFAASAIIFLGFCLLLELGREDTDLYESPLMLSVARQLAAGPGELYGPFGGRNPVVLTHAPLYNRLAEPAVWPVARSGQHPVDAGRAAGRSLSHWACSRHSRQLLAYRDRMACRGEPDGGPCS